MNSTIESTLAVPSQVDFGGNNFKSYLEVFSRRKGIIIWFCILGTALVAILSFMATPLYKASTTIVIENEGSDVLDPSEAGARGVSFDVFENYIQTQMSLIRSRSVAGKVFEDLGLAQLPRYQQTTTNPVRKFINMLTGSVMSMFATTSPEESQPDPLKLFLKDIELERLKGTRAIQISVYNPNPQLAADIANNLAQRYAQDNLMRRALRYIRNQRMASLNADYLRLQSKYDYMSNLYGPKHHEMITLKNEIQALASRIEKEEARNKSEAASERPFGDVSPEEEEQMLSNILMKIQETSILSSSQMDNIVVADPAFPPNEVAVPKKKMNILIGFLGSLLAGIFLAFLIDYIDDTIKGEDDLKKVLGNSIFLGTIPFDERVKGFNRLSKMDRLVMQKPLSGTAEAYRLIRVRLQWFSSKDPFFKDFAVVSSIPDEGKSTISSNLAIALAQLDKKILLVDTDMRRGRLHKTYRTRNKKGLGQYLIEEATFDEIIQKTSVPNLWMVTPGENLMLGSELLSSTKMTEFIEETRRHFDMVVYDTPPITLISDTSVLLSQLHGAILVSRVGVTRSRIVPKSLAMIRNADTNLLGVVLNSSKETENNKYYHRYYRD